MKPVIRVKDFLDRERQLLTYGFLLTEEEALIKFAELHVTQALEAASGSADADFTWLKPEHELLVPGEDYEVYVMNTSILEAYPLSNIK